MEQGAKGVEIIVSGKLRGQRAKAMKFVDGLMIHSGDPINNYVQKAVKHVELRQGVLGIKIKIMLNWDPNGKKIFNRFLLKSFLSKTSAIYKSTFSLLDFKCVDYKSLS
jgi:ribosomal protein S3